jgi:hypothetical protein
MFNVAWENFVHESFQRRSGDAAGRQPELVIALGRIDGPVPRDQIATLTPGLAAAYAGRQKTVTRDVNKAVETDLVRRHRGSIQAAREIMFGFTPPAGGHIRSKVLVDFSDVRTEFD